MTLLAALLGAVVALSLVYYLLVIEATRRYKAVKPPAGPVHPDLPPISILTPLAGRDLTLEDNLRALFTQDYPDFELLFAVREASDPAVPVAEALIAAFPGRPARLLIVGQPACPNAKVHSLKHMLAAARHDLLVMVDSDVRGGPDMLRRFAAEFDPGVGMVTAPYRAVPGPGFWSKLEAIGMNTQFLAGVLAARMLEGMHFALGPCLAARRAAIYKIGGFERVEEYLAEDFVLGQFAHQAGWRVILSSYIVEHHIGSARFLSNVAHRIRWVRSNRRSRPKGYAGEVFTNPLPLALAAVTIEPRAWPLAAITVLVRAAAAAATAGWLLRDPLTLRYAWALPIQDVLAFLIWIAGFFGNHITWRGRVYYLHRDGRFELVGTQER